MNTDRQCIVAFKSTSLAMLAERAARKNSISVRLSAVPRQISKDCTLGIRTAPENIDALKKLFEELKIECRFAVLNS